MQYLHNPRCSKSRQGLELLEQQNLQAEVRLYLKDPLNLNELKNLMSALKLDDAKKMMRTKEPEFKTLNLSSASTDELLNALLTTPKLLERPILINGNQAAIGRPPEQLLEIV